MKTKCLIIDDEALAIEVLESYLEKFSDIEIVAKCESAIAALDVLRKKQVDLIFLDIQMPELTGLDFLKTYNYPVKVILTTAHRKYALEGYEFDVLDYLLKPISFERFLKALNKYYKLTDAGLKFNRNNESESSLQDDFIYVKENKNLVKIDLGDIIYIESMKDYVRFCTTKNKVITKITMSELEEKLPPDKFVRIHRSFIISILKIDSFTPVSIKIGSKEFTIGRYYKNNVMNTLRHSVWI